MRQLSDAFIDANLTYSRKPVVVVKVINDQKNIYFTSGSGVTIIDPGSDILSGCVIACGGSSQKITPERGYSSLGSVSVAVADDGLTEILRGLLDNFNDTINNNKTEIYTGFTDIDFADYALVTTLWVAKVDNNETAYNLVLSDTQRFAKKSIFSDLANTTIVGSLGPSEVGSLEVLDASNFERVEHDSGWRDAPSQTIGYVRFTGTNESGEPVEEVASWTSKDATHLTIDRRGLFGTRPVTVQGSDDGGNMEAVEVVYLDLPVPATVLALQTGDLYGQPGKTIPDSWHAGVTADLIDLVSYEEIGADLWEFRPEFIGLGSDDAKGFIADQLLAPFNLFTSITQAGEFRLRRFGSLPADGTGDLTLDYDSLVDYSSVMRDVKAIRNVFSIRWEWDFISGEYVRRNAFIDGDSIAANNITSDEYSIRLKGIRNRNRDSGLVIDQLAQGIRARFSQPRVTPKVVALIRDAIELEVGDIVTLDLPNVPDFASPDTLRAAYEVQGLTWDFLAGTVSLDLFGSSGQAAEIELSNGVDPVTIDHTGWTDLDGWPGTITVSDLLTFTADSTLPTGQYYFDGDIRVNDGVTITGDERVVIDYRDLTIVGTGRLDFAEKGPVGVAGAFGGEDARQEGMYTGIAWFNRYFRRSDTSAAKVPAVNPDGLPVSTVAYVDDSDVIQGLPETVHGNGGDSGGTLRVRDSITVNGDYAGAPASRGGGGLILIGENLFFDNADCIDVSGADNSDVVAQIPIAGAGTYYSGAGGFGWPGSVFFYSKTRANPLPNLAGSGGAVRAKTGAWSEANGFTADARPKRNGEREYSTPSGDRVVPFAPSARGNADLELNGLVSRNFRLAKNAPFVPEPGVDTVDSAQAPILTVEQRVNVPDTPKGDQVTMVVTALPQPGDTVFQYAAIEYRLQGKDEWYTADYGITTESTFQVTADGSTYEIRATSVNVLDKRGGESTTFETMPVVDEDSDTSLGGEPDAPDTVAVPKPRGLKLNNSIDILEGWDKFKSPSAEFSWLVSGFDNPSAPTALGGSPDLRLKGYNVRLTNTANGETLREEFTEEPFYTYTFDRNKVDTDGAPVRAFTFEVQSVATTGFASEWAGFPVENPAPAAPTGIVVQPGYTTLSVIYTLPTDVDFVGVDVYILVGSGDPFADGVVARFSGNNPVLDDLLPGQLYSIGLTSVDQFGTGESAAIIEISTVLIESTALGAITTPVVIDETGGRLITNNSGFIAFHGATDVPAVSAEPLIFGMTDGIDYPFWINALGEFSFGTGEKYLRFVGGDLTAGSDTVLPRSFAWEGGHIFQACPWDALVNTITAKDKTDWELVTSASSSTIRSGSGTSTYRNLALTTGGSRESICHVTDLIGDTNPVLVGDPAKGLRATSFRCKMFASQLNLISGWSMVRGVGTGSGALSGTLTAVGIKVIAGSPRKVELGYASDLDTFAKVGATTDLSPTSAGLMLEITHVKDTDDYDVSVYEKASVAVPYLLIRSETVTTSEDFGFVTKLVSSSILEASTSFNAGDVFGAGSGTVYFEELVS